MIHAIKYALLLPLAIISYSSTRTGQQLAATNFSAPDRIVLQICPDEQTGDVTVKGKHYRRTAAYVFLPGTTEGTTISCPLNYFQENCSIPGKWIEGDQHEKIRLTNIERLDRVVITKKRNNIEEQLKISDDILRRLFKYFQLDIAHHLPEFKGFDCYAFQSLLYNLRLTPQKPSWRYKDTIPQPGDCVVLASERNLPDAIQHWSIYLGEDLYLSKFGRAGEGYEAQVTVMNLEGMKLLYDSRYAYVAYPKTGAEKWNGFKPN